MKIVLGHTMPSVESGPLIRKAIEICIKARSTPASLLFKGLVNKHVPIKWSIGWDKELLENNNEVKHPF